MHAKVYHNLAAARMQFRGRGTRILRVIHGQDARATFYFGRRAGLTAAATNARSAI